MNILPLAFLEKFPGRYSVDTNQSSKYCKKTFRSHENRGTSTLENGRSDGLSSNLCEFMSLISILLKNISIKEQNFTVPAASGGTYFKNTLLAVEIITCKASLTFIMEYGVTLICSMHNLGSI